MKRLKFILKALVEIIRATKGYPCDKALVVLTEEELLEYREDKSRMGINLQLCYQCIDTMVMGGTPCYLCNEYDTCEHKGKDTHAPGCDMWDLVEVIRAEEAEERMAANEQAAAPEGTKESAKVCKADT